jgi:hypothetical protein
MPGIRSKITPIMPRKTRTPNVDANNPRQAFQSVQQAFDAVYRALTSGELGIEELFVTGEGGRLTAWIGTRTHGDRRYSGGYFQELYVGGDDGPPTAPFYALEEDDEINVVIGKNGSVSLRDIGDNEVGWLGTQWDDPIAVTGATNATPVVITTDTQDWENGDTILVAGIGGNTAANGYRIVKNVTATTAELTDLAGTDVAGNGAFSGAGTAQRYYGGGRFQTIALGESFSDYKARLFANGDYRIRNALIELEGPDATITINPDPGLITIIGDTHETWIEEGYITVRQVANPLNRLILNSEGIILQEEVGPFISTLVTIDDNGVNSLEGFKIGPSTVISSSLNGILNSLSLFTPLAVSFGGTGAITAGNARTNLDVYSKAETDALVNLSNYYTKAEVDALLSGKANTGHTHTVIATSAHTHGGVVTADGAHSHTII